MQAKTRGLTHTPPNPPTLGDFELAFVVWSKPRVLLPPKLGGWGAIFVRVLISRKVFIANICMLKTIGPKNEEQPHDTTLKLHLSTETSERKLCFRTSKPSFKML
jgi:hypothetical protein